MRLAVTISLLLLAGCGAPNGIERLNGSIIEVRVVQAGPGNGAQVVSCSFLAKTDRGPVSFVTSEPSLAAICALKREGDPITLRWHGVHGCYTWDTGDESGYRHWCVQK